MDNLNKIISKKNYYALYESTLICEKAKEVLKNIMDRNVNVISFKNGTLKIRSVDNFFDTNVKSQRYEIIDKTNQKIGRKAVERISISR